MSDVLCFSSYIERQKKKLTANELCEEAVEHNNGIDAELNKLDLLNIINTSLELILREHDYDPDDDSHTNRACRLLAAALTSV